MKWLPSNLKARIGGALFLASVVPTLIVGVLAVSQLRSTLSDAARESNLALIASLGSELNTVLQESRRTLDIIAALPAARREGTERRKLLRVVTRREPLLREVYVMDASGHIVDAAGNYAPGLSGRHPASYGGYVTDAYQTGASQVVTVIVEMRDERLQTYGYLCGDIDLAVVSDLMAQTPLPDHAQMFIVDANRRVIAKTPSAQTDSASQAIEAVHSTLAPGSLMTIDDQNRQWLSVYRNMGAYDEFRGLRWGIVLQQQTKYAFANAHRTAAFIGLLTILFIVISVAAGRLMASGLAAPLARLARQADRVADGELAGEPIQGNLPSEVLHLARRFREMAQRVHTSRQELTQRSEQLQQLHDLYSSVVQTLPVGVGATDASGKLVTANPALTQMTGRSLLGVDVSTADAGDVVGSAIARAVSSVLAGGDPVDQTFDRTRLPISLRATDRARMRVAAIGTQPGVVRGAVILLEDLSNEARMEAAVLQSEKLSSVGELAAGIAHEINNPLTAILGYSRLLLEDIPTDSEQYGPMRILADEATRVQGIVRNLLDFSRPGSAEARPVDVNSSLDKILSVMAPQFRKARISVRTQWGDTGMILGDDHKLQQVFVNIAANAVHAMERGGTLNISTGKGPDGVWVRFLDDGPGIPEEILPRIFDPFFTTKGPGRGTGLGLSISYGIVRELGGVIDVRNEPDAGASFLITLPAGAFDEQRSAASASSRR